MELRLPEVSSIPDPIRYVGKGALLLTGVAAVIGTVWYIIDTYTQIVEWLFVICVVLFVTGVTGWLID